jgi:glutamate dehydrogenase (NADP+)
MPSSEAAIKVFAQNKVVLCPGKAANAGGVSVSGMEMSQNSIRTNWSREQVDDKLKGVMKNIYDTCKSASASYGLSSIQDGANIAGFLKVANAVIDQGN